MQNFNICGLWVVFGPYRGSGGRGGPPLFENAKSGLPSQKIFFEILFFYFASPSFISQWESFRLLLAFFV